MARSLRVWYNTCYSWIGYNVSCEHQDGIGLDYVWKKWTHVQLWLGPIKNIIFCAELHTAVNAPIVPPFALSEASRRFRVYDQLIQAYYSCPWYESGPDISSWPTESWADASKWTDSNLFVVVVVVVAARQNSFFRLTTADKNNFFCRLCFNGCRGRGVPI